MRQQIGDVCLLSPGWPATTAPFGIPNGVVTYVSCIRDAMTRRGVRVGVASGLGEATDDLTIINPSSKHGWLRRIFDGIQQIHAPERVIARNLASGYEAALARIRKQMKLQLCEVDEGWGVGSLLMPRLDVPLVVRLHGTWALAALHAGVKLDSHFRRRVTMEEQTIRSASGISAPTRFALEAVRRCYEIPLSNAVVISNPMSPVWLQDRWTLQDSDPHRILFVGRFDRLKGGDTLLDAFAMVHREMPQAKLSFIGVDLGCNDGSGRICKIDDYLQRKLSSAARQNVEFLGILPLPAITPHRLRARVTVVCSRFESFSYAALEATARGCPLVSSSAGGLAEMLHHEKTALLFTPGDAPGLAQNVLVILRQPEYASKLGDAARSDAQTRFDADDIARRTLEFYAEVLARNNHTAT